MIAALPGLQSNSPAANTRSQAATTPPAPTLSMTEQMAIVLQSLQRIEGAEARTAKKIDELESNLGRRIKAAETRVEAVQERVTEVANTVLLLEEELETVKAQHVDVRALEKALPEMVNRILEKQDGPASLPGPSRKRRRPLGSPTNADQRMVGKPDKEDKYWIARRSLLLWPIKGENLPEAARAYLTDHLLMDPFQVKDYVLDVRKVRGRPREGAHDECRVIFESVEERDEARSHARNLVPKAAGLRNDVPDHLRSSERVLDSVAFQLRRKFPAMKRNVKFNDRELDLQMDFCTGGKKWQTILPHDARNSLKKRRLDPGRTASVSDRDLDDLLESDGEQQPTGPPPRSSGQWQETNLSDGDSSDTGTVTEMEQR